MAVTTIVYEARCPACDGTHDVRAQTGIASWETTGARELRRGDRFVRADLDARGYVRTGAPSATSVRVLEGGRRCGTQELWTEVSIQGDVIVDLALVRFESKMLDRLHYICSGHCTFWDWVRSLPDPGDWNEDVFYTRDKIRNLRTRMLLQEPLATRDESELAVFLETLGCTASGPLVRISDTLWEQRCRTEFWPEELRLEVALGASRPSKILPADILRQRATQLVAGVPSYTADLEGLDARLDAARRTLAEASSWLEDLIAMIPPGSDAVLLEHFWGDRSRTEREERPDRYSFTRLSETLERWGRARAQIGIRPNPVVRTAEEADVYMAIHPCPRCGQPTPHLASRIIAAGDALMSVYEGPCPACKLPRRFEMVLAEAMPLEQIDDTSSLGDGRSECMDPGQLLVAADVFANRATRASGPIATYARRIAIATLDEALKWIPERGTSVPEASIQSPAGWALYDESPERFAAASIAERKTELR